MQELVVSLSRRRLAAVLAPTALGVGIVLLAAGVGPGVGVIGLGLLLAGLVDRRLMLLAAVFVTPGLTAFNATELARVGDSILDVRLVLTATLAFTLWFWLAVDRPRISVIAGMFGLYVLVAMLLTVLNQVAPLKAGPVLARDLVYFGAFIAAQAWLGTRRGANALLVAAAAGLLVPSVAGILQWATGGGLVAAGAWRLTGLYGTSPVGMALAMQIGVVCLSGGALTEGFSRRFRWLAGISALVLMCILLSQTSTRLPFVTTVAALVVFELARRRLVGIVAVIAIAAVLLATNAGLAARVGSTFVPEPTPIAIAPASLPPAAGQSPTAAVPGAGTADEDVGGGGASLRYRLFVWRTMLKEWAQSPLLGRGTGSFATLFEGSTGMLRVAPHNDYLYALVEGGVILFLLYVALQAAIVLGLLGRIVKAADARLPIVALGIFVATNITNSINNAVFYVDLQLIVWAVAASVLASTEVRPPALSEYLQLRRSNRRSTILIVDPDQPVPDDIANQNLTNGDPGRQGGQHASAPGSLRVRLPSPAAASGARAPVRDHLAGSDSLPRT